MSNQSLQISKKTFLASLAILFLLMVSAGILTHVLPQGSFQRVTEEGREMVAAGSYRQSDSQTPLPFYRVLTAPVEVLFSPDAGTVAGIILFLILISGAIGLLNQRGITTYTVQRAAGRFRHNRYRLLAFISFLFMLFGSVIGAFEECATLVPFIVALSLAMGWDALTGLGMSLLAAGFGFAAAVCNPFTVSIAQEIAGLPVYSGIWFRILGFLLVYLLLLAFLLRHSKKISSDVSAVPADTSAQVSPSMDRAMKAFLWALGGMLAMVLLCMVIPALSGLSLFLMILPLTAGAFAAGRYAAGPDSPPLLKDYLRGVLGMLPAVAMILMASSIKLIITNGNILDTILYYASEAAGSVAPGLCTLIIYLFVLILNFFIASGSAKAFLLMPILTPLADLVGITRQSAVLAFCYGDGFSNVFFPTNPVLLICLGLASVSYGSWFRFTWKIQAAVLAVTGLLLLLAQAVGLGPF